MNGCWWKDGVAYQIYVRSFKDSNGNGIGDIRGIIEKLDYLQDLGIDIIYLNPINKSPNDDNGYDISDFREIMDEFGDMNDFDELLAEIHKRGMRFVLDLVINHTSDEHEWFQQGKTSKDNKYHDYYLWHHGKNGTVPNNWGSFFGGSAWEYNELTDEYYLHLFSKKQPDLNWENESLRKDINDMIEFWIDKGVDGFRLDAINHIAKDNRFLDGEIHEGQIYGDFIKYVQNLPEVHTYLKELRKNVFKPHNVLIGETGGVSYHNAEIYTGVDRGELDFTFHFDMHSVGKGDKDWERKPINLIEDIKKPLSGWQNRDDKEGWCPLFYSNHDTTRTVSRLGDDIRFLEESAKMLFTIQMTQKGTPFIYYGDEIGMTNAWDYKLEDYRDVSVFNKHKDFVQSGKVSEENYLKGLHYTARDNARTPMQWNKEENAGFTKGSSWINVNSNYKEINVEDQEQNENSILNYVKKLIATRKNNKALIYGGFKEYFNEHKSIYAYTRGLENDKFLVLVNFFGEKLKELLPMELANSSFEVILSNYGKNDFHRNEEEFELQPYESYILKII